MNFMNSLFCYRSSCPIDVCQLYSKHSPFLKRVTRLSKGLYVKAASGKSLYGLLSYYFLSDAEVRRNMIVPNENIETMNVEFNTKLQDFQKNFNTLTDIAKEMKEKDLNDLQARIREFQERAQQEYQKKQNELLSPIIEKAKNAIDKISAAGGYLVVFDTSTGSLAYFDEATLTDIAPEVKKELGITETPAATTTPAPAAE